MRGGKPYSVCAGSGRSAQLKNPHMETETEKRTKTFYNWVSHIALIWIVNLVRGKQNCSFILLFAIYFKGFSLAYINLSGYTFCLRLLWPPDELKKKKIYNTYKAKEHNFSQAHAQTNAFPVLVMQTQQFLQHSKENTTGSWHLIQLAKSQPVSKDVLL